MKLKLQCLQIVQVLNGGLLYNTTMKYKTNCNVVYSCKYHVVWCPKYRRKVLTDGVDIRLKELLLSYAANLNVDILEMEIMPDHVHIIIKIEKQPKNGRTLFAPTSETPTLSRVIKHFKEAVTKELGYSIWQKSFYDTIIKNRKQHAEIRQ